MVLRSLPCRFLDRELKQSILVQRETQNGETDAARTINPTRTDFLLPMRLTRRAETNRCVFDLEEKLQRERES